MANPTLIVGQVGRGTVLNLPYRDGSATFSMGSTLWRHSWPEHKVTLTKPIAVQQTPVTVDEFRDHIEISKRLGIRHGRFIHGPDGRIASILCADSEEAVRRMGLRLQAGQSFASISDILPLVPTMQQFEERYAHLERGGAEFLKGDHPVGCVKWFEAVACAHLYYGGTLLTEAEWEYATRTVDIRDGMAGMDTGVKRYEWVLDGWTDNYNDSMTMDPVGPLFTTRLRAVRYLVSGSHADRNCGDLDDCSHAVGFRVGVPPQPPSYLINHSTVIQPAGA